MKIQKIPKSSFILNPSRILCLFGKHDLEYDYYTIRVVGSQERERDYMACKRCSYMRIENELK